MLFPKLAPVIVQFYDEFFRFKRFFNSDQELIKAYRFSYIIVRSQAHRLYSGVDLPESRDDDHNDIFVSLLDPLEHFEAI